MAEKTLTVVVCDLCKKDRPATQTITIDVCSNHGHMLEQKVLPFPCPECERSFKSKPALTKHLTDTHGHEPTTQKARDRRNGKKAARRRSTRR